MQGSHHSNDAIDAGMGRFNIRESIARRGFMVVLLCPAIFLFLTNENFRSLQNLSNVLAQSSIVGVVSVGMTIVMIAGGFDLSIGATAALAGLVAVIVFGHGEPIFMALGIVAAVGSGIAVGLVNGLLVSRVEINPLIATLAMSSIVRGIVLIASEGTIYPILSRLKRDGLVRTTLEESPSGPARKYYELTRRGELLLTDMNRYWETLTREVSDLRKANT